MTTKTRTSMRDRVVIGQVWKRRRDGRPHRVRQVHRHERVVQLVDDGDAGAKLTVSFSDLRRKWRHLSDPR